MPASALSHTPANTPTHHRPKVASDIGAAHYGDTAPISSASTAAQTPLEATISSLEGKFVKVSPAMRDRLDRPASADDMTRLANEFPKLQGDEMAARVYREVRHFGRRRAMAHAALVVSVPVAVMVGIPLAASGVGLPAVVASLVGGTSLWGYGESTGRQEDRLLNMLYDRAGAGRGI